MVTRVLVAYSSKYGATKEISEKIGEVIRGAGMAVDVLPAKDVHDLTPYQAVILGCAVYIGKWLKEAGDFLKVNEKSLAQHPLWLFSSGPTGEGNPVDLLGGWQLPRDQQTIINRIQPRAITVFQGNISTDKVNPIEKWTVKSLVRKPFGDFRDWDVINSWATSIATALRGAS
jgi:menaquinone-dependent protoporphyrinogen oxidase